MRPEQKYFCSGPFESGKRGSNSRPQPWQGCALPTELFPQISSKFTRFSAALGIKASSSALAGTKIPHYCIFFFGEEDETRTHTTQRSLPPQSSASTNSATSPFQFTSRSTECPEQDSNLHVSQHSHLKRARLPFRHLGNQ